MSKDTTGLWMVVNAAWLLVISAVMWAEMRKMTAQLHTLIHRQEMAAETGAPQAPAPDQAVSQETPQGDCDTGEIATGRHFHVLIDNREGTLIFTGSRVNQVTEAPVSRMAETPINQIIGALLETIQRYTGKDVEDGKGEQQQHEPSQGGQE